MANSKEYQKAYQKAYDKDRYPGIREKKLEQKKEYRAKNKEKIKEYDRQYYRKKKSLLTKQGKNMEDLENNKEIANEVIKPIIDIIDNYFFDSVDCDNGEKESKLLVNLKEDKKEILDNIINHLKERIDFYSNGSVLITAMSGNGDIASQKEGECLIMLKFSKLIDQFVEAREEQRVASVERIRTDAQRKNFKENFGL